ncbi:DNA-binding transcriptional MerR regulator [Rhodoligotrophos appendicifer]|uniref:MerR family transcriptional regulator n=1 Tax=Rhodoligotrophos appendicifer TaxID=987056 RepID=UPI00118483ED|nr:MerR family transcriptional regulator [Rhodoligotrophos appendicifer]
MPSTAPVLSASEAAQRLGVSPKALRLYEQRGLVVPARTAAGWRAYGPAEMARAGEVVALRALGLSLAQVARVLKGEAHGLERALTAHQAVLEHQIRSLSDSLDAVRSLRSDLASGRIPGLGAVARLAGEVSPSPVRFALPWPWGGESFELPDRTPLTYITGPLGSGKTRLGRRIAESLPEAAFLGLDRLDNGAAAARRQLEQDDALKARVDEAAAWLVEDGADMSEALLALLVGLESEGPAALVVDMVEQGLDASAQTAVIAFLRCRGNAARPLFLLTRSSAILDLAALGRDEAILFCPANHSPPMWVLAVPGAPGYEAVATCLASPEVRARTAGVIAWRPAVA